MAQCTDHKANAGSQVGINVLEKKWIIRYFTFGAHFSSVSALNLLVTQGARGVTTLHPAKQIWLIGVFVTQIKKYSAEFQDDVFCTYATDQPWLITIVVNRMDRDGYFSIFVAITLTIGICPGCATWLIHYYNRAQCLSVHTTRQQSPYYCCHLPKVDTLNSPKTDKNMLHNTA